MTTTTTKQIALDATLARLDGYHTSVDVWAWQHGDDVWALIDDQQSRWWVGADDITDSALDELLEGGEWTDFCQSHDSHYDDAVPAAVVADAREALNLDDDADVSAGW